MDLTELLTQCPGMSVTVSLSELLTFGRQLAQDVLDEANAAVRAREAVVGCTLIPAKEAREILGNPDPSTMYRWRKAGYLNIVKIGVRNFYTASDLKHLIEAHRENKQNNRLTR